MENLIYTNPSDIPYTFLRTALRRIEGKRGFVRAKIYQKCKKKKYLNGRVCITLEGSFSRARVLEILEIITPTGKLPKNYYPLYDFDWYEYTDGDGFPITDIYSIKGVDYTKL